MRNSSLALLIAVLGLLSLEAAEAQAVDIGLRQPASVNQVSYTTDGYLASYAEEDVSSSPSDESPVNVDSCTSSCGACEAACCQPAGCGCRCGCAAPAAPWKLPQPCLLQRLGIATGGWLQAGFTINGDKQTDGFNGPLLTNDQDRQLQMNQLWLYFDKPVDTGGCGFDIGGRLDLVYGTDWRVGAANSYELENRFNNENNLYGLMIPQLYAEVAYNNLSVKMGHMTGILGYEMVPAVGNFFYSHSYAICYSEPILITGLMAKYQLGEQITAMAGFHRGWGMWEDNNGELNFQGGVTFTSASGKSSLAYALDAGRNDPLAASDQYVHSLVWKLQVSERMLYVLQNDLGTTKNVAALGGANAEWYGINQYLLYTLNEKWAAGMRVEWFRDDDGVRVGGLGAFGWKGWRGAGGYAGNFTALTAGLNWKPCANLMFRPEVRWDWYDGPASGVPGNPSPLPFNNGASDNQFTFAADMVLTY